MAKKSMVNREVKRAKLVKQHASKRAALKAVINDQAKPVAERFKATKAVGELKAANNLPPADKAREAEQIARLRKLANDAELDPDFAEKFLAFIVTEVIRHHEKLQGKG